MRLPLPAWSFSRPSKGSSSRGSPDAPPVEIRRAEIEVQRAARLEEAEARIRQALRDSRDALVCRRLRTNAERKELALALQRFEVANARYKAGDLSLMDPLLAEKTGSWKPLTLPQAPGLQRQESPFLRLIDETATKTQHLLLTGGFGLYLHE